MAIFLVYSTSGITFGKKVYRELKMAAILKFFEYQTQLQSDLWYEKIVPNYAKKFSYGDDVIDDVTGWPQSLLYIQVQERLTPGANCKGNVSSINANIIIVFLGYTSQKRSQWITHFEIASQGSTSRVYCVTLALISNIENYFKYNYFWDCDGIDNVTLRLWTFSDFCSRHTVGVAGDDIMFHILVVCY